MPGAMVEGAAVIVGLWLGSRLCYGRETRGSGVVMARLVWDEMITVVWWLCGQLLLHALPDSNNENEIIILI